MWYIISLILTIFVFSIFGCPSKKVEVQKIPIVGEEIFDKKVFTIETVYVLYMDPVLIVVKQPPTVKMDPVKIIIHHSDMMY